MEEENCPECGNEIFKPFNHCNACGWEKKEKEGGKEEEKEEIKKKSKKGPKKETEKAKKPIKIKCKCGSSITVKSDKRPLKIKCPDCGRSGTLKAPPETKDEKPKKSKKPEKPEKPTPPKHKHEIEKPAEKKREMKHDLKKKMRPGRELRKGPGPKKRRIDRREERGAEEEFCPECGTRLGITGLCPKCGYRTGPGSTYKAKDTPSSRKKQRHKPPKGASALKPKKGICSNCDSKNLRFYDDGSGRCSDCGREFRWDGGASRLQQDEYECPKCGKLLEWVEKYERWYCYSCEEYQ